MHAYLTPTHESSYPKTRRNAVSDVPVLQNIAGSGVRVRRNAEPTIHAMTTRSSSHKTSIKKQDDVSEASMVLATASGGSEAGQRSMLDRWADDAKDLTEDAELICHPVGWTKKNHYSDLGWMWCGQSCPCCRTRCGDILGGCQICVRS